MLKGKIAIVTGGTRGIGFATVKKYLENGATVVLFGSRQETVDKAIQELKAKNKNWPVEGLTPDLKNADEIDKAIGYVNEKYGRVDILVNNAGISHSMPFYDYTQKDADDIFDLNIRAVFLASLSAARIMKAQGGGTIINTSSMVSITGQTAGAGYPTSKFAVNGLTLSLARELGKDNIRVNAVAPGIIETDLVAALPEELIKAISAQVPLGRTGQPEDIANAFLYLASDLASYVTGEILSVDGATRL